MSEVLPQSNEDMNRLVAISRLVDHYFPDDKKFMLEQLADEEDIVTFLYGSLLEIGEDPDEILRTFGITEEKE